MKKLIGVAVILLTLLLTVIYRQLTGGRSKERPGHTCVVRGDETEQVVSGRDGLKSEGQTARNTTGQACSLRRLREELPIFQLLIQ